MTDAMQPDLPIVLLRPRKPRLSPRDVDICLLADHLDATLAAGEDLLACQMTAGAPHRGMQPDEIRAEQAELRTFLDRVRALEMALVARVLQARRRALALPRLEDAHAMFANLLIAGTAVLADAVRETGDNVEQQFTAGGSQQAYLRSRGFIGQEAACIAAIADLQVKETFAVYGVVPLGDLLDMVASFLDKLDTVFDLYPEKADFSPRNRSSLDILAQIEQAKSAAAGEPPAALAMSIQLATAVPEDTMPKEAEPIVELDAAATVLSVAEDAYTVPASPPDMVVPPDSAIASTHVSADVGSFPTSAPDEAAADTVACEAGALSTGPDAVTEFESDAGSRSAAMPAPAHDMRDIEESPPSGASPVDALSLPAPERKSLFEALASLPEGQSLFDADGALVREAQESATPVEKAAPKSQA